MRWLNMLVVGLAPLLSYADAVDGAPAGALKAGLTSPHRRALVDAPDSPWHRRYADARRQVSDPNAVVDGPPSVITVPTTPASTPTSSSDTTTTTDTTTTSSLSSSSTSSTSTDTTSSTSPTSTDTTSSTSPTSTDTTSSTSTDTTSTASPTSTDTTSSTSTDTTTSTTSTSTDTNTSTTTTSDTPTSTTPTNAGLGITILPSLPLPETTTTTDTTTPTDTLTGVPTSTSDPTNPTSTSSDPLGISIPIDLPTISISESSTSLPPVIEPSTNTTSVDPTTSVPDPTISTPTDLPTDPPITTPTPTPISSPSSTSVILTIPGDIFPNVTSISIGDVTTDTDTTTTKPPITIESQYQFITATSFLIAPSVSTSTASVTNTDPDAVLTSNSLQSAGPSATVTSAIIPTSIPMFITPPISSDHVAPGTTMDGYTEISILFQSTAGWMWILQSSETAAQILAYMPPILYTSLNCSQTDVKTIGLSAFEPADTTSPDDLMTMWVGLIKTDLVDTLSAMIRTPTSEFYNTGDPVAQAIAKNVVSAYNIATINGVSNEDGASTSTPGTAVIDNSRRNAIIGVSTAFGLTALLVFAWWVVKTYKARQEGIHKRLSYGNAPNYGAAGAGVAAGGAGYGGGVGGGYGAGGVRADSPPMLHNPFLTEREREDEARGIRRNSFYAIGPDDASIEEETFDYMSQHSGPGAGSNLNRAGSSGSGGGRWVSNSGGLTVPGAGGNVGNAGGHTRRLVVGQQISQPILRESSMGNW